MNDYVVLDVETTGFSSDTCELLEIGAWKIRNGVVNTKFVRLIKPQGYIPSNITQLTGITTELVKNEDTVDKVLPEFYDFCENLPLLAHNLPFDYGFVVNKGNAIGIDFTLNNTRLGADTLSLSRKYVADKVVSHKLSSMADYYGIKIEVTDNKRGYHSAGYDAYVTKLLYDSLCNQFPTQDVLQPHLISSIDNTEYGEVKSNEALSFV